jgi:hypothetical protein
MFAVDCRTCGGVSLVFPSQITSVKNTDEGIHVYFTCACGARGLWITGRGATRPGAYRLPDTVAA